MKISTNNLHCKPEGEHKPQSRTDHSVVEIASEVYPIFVIDYANSYGFRCVEGIKQAIKFRSSGEKVLSLREADSAERAKLDLSSSLIVDSFFLLGTCIMEGSPGESNNIWMLRSQYNRGLAWMNKFKGTDMKTASEIEFAERAMRSILESANTLNLPFREAEIKLGVNIELTHPEWMTAQEFEFFKRNGVKSTARTPDLTPVNTSNEEGWKNNAGEKSRE